MVNNNKKIDCLGLKIKNILLINCGDCIRNQGKEELKKKFKCIKLKKKGILLYEK